MFLRVAFPAQLESQKVTPACLPWYLLSFSDVWRTVALTRGQFPQPNTLAASEEFGNFT